MVDEAGIVLAFLMVGVVFGNIILISVALVPLLFLLFSMAYRTQGDIRVERKDHIVKARLNEEVRISTTVTVDNFTGVYLVADPLPEHVLAANGSSVHVYWNNGKARSVPLSYNVRCDKRGIYTVGPAQVESFHHSWTAQSVTKAQEDATRLVIDPERQNMKKVRDPRLHTSMPVPVGAVSKIGMRTTDFTEIRQYQPGDPYRTINWKATARFSMAADPKLYVNEYEKEGKKTVFIFVDARAWMGFGAASDQVFEHVARAASGIASAYLERNMRVGVYVYNYGELIVPDSGRRQSSLILRSLLEVKGDGLTEGDNGLKKAVRECAGHLMGTNPLFVVITMAGRKNARDLIDGIRSMRKYSPGAKIPPITLIHINGYSLEADGPCEKIGASILELDNLQYIKVIKKSGAQVLPWDPSTTSISQLMTAGSGRRQK